VDIIFDFNGDYDSIDAPVPGTPENYSEAMILWDPSTGDVSFAAAHAYAALNDDPALNYVLVTDGVTGYLFGDTVGDGALDFGVRFHSMTSLNQFDYDNII
jgi:hypothetical protein